MYVLTDYVCAFSTDAAVRAVRASVSQHRFVSLVPHLNSQHQEALFEEVIASCDLGQERDVLRCLHPLTMYIGNPPIIHSKIFERWHGESWSDKADL